MPDKQWHAEGVEGAMAPKLHGAPNSQFQKRKWSSFLWLEFHSLTTKTGRVNLGLGVNIIIKEVDPEVAPNPRSPLLTTK